MAYDSSKDEILFQKDARTMDAKTGIEISVCQYDGGPSKVKLQRFGLKKSGERYYLPKLGRFTILEISEVIEVWKEIIAGGWKAS